MKVAINTVYGGFNLSALGIKRYAELTGKTAYFFSASSDLLYHPISLEEAGNAGWFVVFDIPNPQEINENDLWNNHSLCKDLYRGDKILIQVIEELGEKANGGRSKIAIVEVPDEVRWHVAEYDGNEWVAEDHRCWDESGEYGEK